MDLLHKGAKGLASNAKLLELHHVSGQCACLVAKDVLDLTEVCVEVGRAGARRSVGLWVIHVEVDVHVESLKDIDDLNGHIERNGDEVVVEDGKAHIVSEPLRKDEVISGQE